MSCPSVRYSTMASCRSPIWCRQTSTASRSFPPRMKNVAAIAYLCWPSSTNAFLLAAI